jgi:20S proteasome subunit alpha 2
MPLFMLAKSTAELMQEYTQRGGIRPFGISLLIAGVDHEGPKLYQVDPSGAFFAWKATAIGKNAESAKDFLERRYEEDLELEDAIHIALLTMKEGFEGEMNEKNIEVGIVHEDDKEFKVLSEQQVADYLKESS